jgi:uridine kinase
VVLVDGILIFHPESLRKIFDYKIFVDCPEPLRFERRLKRDVEERGRTPEGVHRQYQTTVLPMHNEFVEPTKVFADRVVEGSLDLSPDLQELSSLILAGKI